mmetsp:Transcript_6843/g.17491  ORF Transcript_6843/g.17491 Transcript_6843/m.17491 type:complete len:124 (-) Transcript_6843:1583-1954(-)
MNAKCVGGAARPAVAAQTAKPRKLAVMKTTTRRVQCNAGKRSNDAIPKLEAAVISGAAMLTTTPALAEVGRRMNGDGTARSLGVNEPILGWVLLIVFGTVWALFSQSTKELGGDKGDDSGLTL